MRSTRPSDDQLFMRVARETAARSLCDRDQVGAVIVDSQYRITGTGRNGPPAGYPHGEYTCTDWCARAKACEVDPGFRMVDYSDCPSLHGEMNALLSSDRSRHEGGTIYVTSDPCFACAKAIANSGLRAVVVQTNAQKVHERKADATYSFLESLGVDVILYTKEEIG